MRAELVGLLMLASVLSAQSTPAFEAVSIRRNSSGSSNTRIDISGGRLTITNGSVKTLIRNAYDLLSFQLAAEPRWLDTDMFDIVATTGDGGKITPESFPLLLRTLLADRFRLETHWETREGSVYALTREGDGPQLANAGEPKKPGVNTSKAPGRARMVGTAEPISILAHNLANQLGKFVIDQTALAGAYDWTLEWDPDPTAESTRPSLLTAVREQLGLRLQARRGPMEVLVIDRAEQPSENYAPPSACVDATDHSPCSLGPPCDNVAPYTRRGHVQSGRYRYSRVYSRLRSVRTRQPRRIG